MELTKERKHNTGAYYTPKEWADLAVEYMKKALPEPLEKYVFYDPAGGEGALLEALPEGCEKYATTLEVEDVEIMRSKGLKAWQFDFLNDNIYELPHILHHAAQCGRLVVFTNPPFVKLPSIPKTWAHETYGTNDSIYLFFYRIYEELRANYLCSFNKPLGRPTMSIHGENLYYNWDFLGGFMSWTKEHWGLSGSFAIDFNMFELVDGWIERQEGGRPYIVLDVWQDGEKTGEKKSYFYNRSF